MQFTRAPVRQLGDSASCGRHHLRREVRRLPAVAAFTLRYPRLTPPKTRRAGANYLPSLKGVFELDHQIISASEDR